MHDHGAHTHGNGVGRKRLTIALTITLTVLVTEIVGAIITSSLALLVDVGHLVTDAAGLTMALVAAYLSERPATSTHTWGWRRAEVISAALQALILICVGGYALIEAINRLVTPQPVVAEGLLIVGIVGLVGNLASLAVLRDAKSANLNLRAAFLEVANDALGSVAVILSAIVVKTTGWHQIDAIASLCIAALIVPRAIVILRSAGKVLLEATPEGLNLDQVRTHLMELPHVEEIHDLHVSTVAAGLPVLTAHIVLPDECFQSGHYAEILTEIQDCLISHHGMEISHSTVQLEPEAVAATHRERMCV